MFKPTYFTLCFAIAILLISCEAQTSGWTTAEMTKTLNPNSELTATLQVTTSMIPTPSSWDVLHLNICASPCWLGITPGETSGDEAEEILKSYYHVEKAEKEVKDTVFLEWEFAQGDSLPRSTITVRHNLVESIHLGVPDGNISVSDVISHFGEPEFVWWAFTERHPPANGCGENMVLSYPDYTLIILPENSDIISITPITSVMVIEFQSRFSLPSISDWTPPIKWAGYEGEYCPPGGRLP